MPLFRSELPALTGLRLAGVHNVRETLEPWLRFHERNVDLVFWVDTHLHVKDTYALYNNIYGPDFDDLSEASIGWRGGGLLSIRYTSGEVQLEDCDRQLHRALRHLSRTRPVTYLDHIILGQRGRPYSLLQRGLFC